MPEASDLAGKLLQNLLDAGCDTTTAQYGIALAKDGKTAELLHLLITYRLDLLERLHHQQQQLDCLDFLIYQLETTRSKP